MIAAVWLFAMLLDGVAAIAAAGRAEGGVDAWPALQAAVDRAGDGEVVFLSGDVTASASDASLIIPAGKCLVLDLDGYVLDRHLDETGERVDPAITVEAGAILTIRDSGGSGVITDGFYHTGGGVWNCGTLIMEGGCVTGNIALHVGGGVANYGTMVLTGGAVTGNEAHRRGGGVYNYATAHLTVNGEAVFGNSAPKGDDIFNEGMLTVSGAQPGGAYIEEAPVLRRYMSQLSILPVAALLLALLLAVWLDAYLTRQRKRTMIVIIALVFSMILQNYLDKTCATSSTI